MLALLFVAAGPVREATAQSPTAKVASIEIRGNKKIELPAIQGRLTLKPGDPYTPENVRGQIKILYETGYFEDVQVETESAPDGIALTFIVQEKPFITEIVFDGNEELSDDKLKEKITIKSQAFLDQQQAKESAEKIRLAYQEDGYFSAQVIPIVQTLDEDRKRLTFFGRRKSQDQDRQFRGHAIGHEERGLQGDGDARMGAVVRLVHPAQAAVVSLRRRGIEARGNEQRRRADQGGAAQQGLSQRPGRFADGRVE
jgi:hypothetical protein